MSTITEPVPVSRLQKSLVRDAIDPAHGRIALATEKQTLERYRSANLEIHRPFGHIDRPDHATDSAKRRSRAIH